MRLKFNPLAEVAGKRVVVVDDSIVRGNTTRQIVQMLFDAGAAEVHVRISAPPVIGPCFYGIDLADPEELIARDRSVEEVREYIGATSLAYLSHDGLVAATRRPGDELCRACLTGEYPTAVPAELASSASSRLLARASGDDNVVGVIHSGSRGRGLYVHDDSDWDFFVVVRELRGDYPSEHGDHVEYAEITLERLADPPEWARPALLSVDLMLDKSGGVATALRTATTVDPANAGEPLDGYINMYYRSAKNARVGLELASLLDAQESIPWFLQFVFNVHGRVRPYNKWLEWELRKHPLPVDVDVELLRRIAVTGDIATQQALFRWTEQLAREHGHGKTVDGWKPDLEWLRGT